MIYNIFKVEKRNLTTQDIDKRTEEGKGVKYQGRKETKKWNMENVYIIYDYQRKKRRGRI